MMSFTFDLISDLHVETWPDHFEWEGRATSQFCVVAGDVCRDRDLLVDTLTKISRCYQAVFYIDGNDEHMDYIDDLGHSYNHLAKRISNIPNLVYLQDNVAVIDGVAILGTNGWWGYDLDLGIDPEQSALWHREKMNFTAEHTNGIRTMSNTDAAYMLQSVRRLQTHKDVRKIVMVTHTVPDPQLVAHDIDLDGKLRMNTMGNRYMMQSLGVDTENKIHTWCFGHYHGAIDQVHSNVRFVNNCRGRGDTKYSNWVYHPLRITVD